MNIRKFAARNSHLADDPPLVSLHTCPLANTDEADESLPSIEGGWKKC
jgi:hypothetical protein